MVVRCLAEIEFSRTRGAKDRQPRRRQPLKDLRGGLTAAGRRHFKQKFGNNLRPGVRGPADTPEKKRRKGQYLRRFFGRQSLPPLTKPNGEPTRLALSANAWGERPPKTVAQARRLAAKGSRLLGQYRRSKSRSAQ